MEELYTIRGLIPPLLPSPPDASYSTYLYPGEECLMEIEKAIDVVKIEMKYAKSDETRKALVKVLDCIHAIKESAVSTRDGKHVLEKGYSCSSR